MKRLVNTLGAILLVLVAALFFLLKPGEIQDLPALDASTHPLYGSYDFGHDNRIVDVGIQPLWLPTSAIAEVMKRDLLLKNALSGQGLDVRFHPFLKGADVNFFLQRKDLEVAMGGDMPALMACAASGAVITSLIQQGFSAIVARRPILVKELRGKRIGYAPGSNAHYALLRTLSFAGMQETDVLLIPLDVHEMAEALNEDEIDAFSAWEPTPTMSTVRYQEFEVIHKSLTSGYLYFSSSFADRYPDAVREIMASELRVLSWIRDSGQNLLEASRWALQAEHDFTDQASVLTPEKYAAIFKNDLLGTTTVPAISERSLAPAGRLYREFELLQEMGKISNAIDWGKVKSCFDRSFLKQVLQNAQEYRLDIYDYERSGRQMR